MPAARCGGMASGGEARGEAGLGIEPQHEVHVLHRGARGSLAEVVEHGGQHRLVVGGVAEDIEAQVVGAVEAFGVEALRSEEHTSELQSLMRISYAVFCLKKKIQ